MNLKEIEKVVGMIQSHIFKNSNSYSTGMLKSHFRGSGLQFREHQVYVPGDDVRFIDWKLSARSSNIYIKTFEEERNVEIVICLDLCQSLYYGHNEISKLQALIEIIGLLYLLSGETHDLVRVIIWWDKVINLPPKSGKEGLTLFISMLEKLEILDENAKVILSKQAVKEKVSEKTKISTLKSHLGRRKEVIYLGDLSLLEDKETWSKILDRKNMHCFRIFSPIDKNTHFPFLFKAKNPLTGKGQLVELFSREDEPIFVKERYKEIGVHERYLEKFIRELV